MLIPLLFSASLLMSIPQTTPTASETIDVNVVEVNVVVLDANGRPVTGLTGKDFELFVGGRKRQISNFYAVSNVSPEKATQAAAAAGVAAEVTPIERRNYVVIVVDNTHLHQKGRKRALDALRRFLEKNVGPATSAMLVTFDDSVTVQQPFTDDRARLTAAIDRIESQPAKANQYESDRRQLIHMLDDARPDVILIYRQQMEELANREEHATEQTIDAMKEVVRATAGLDGRRTFVYVSDGLPMQPGAEIYQYYDSIRERKLGTGTARIANRAMGNLTLLDSLRTQLADRFDKLAKEAAVTGMQFFAIDAGGTRGFDVTGADPAADAKLDWNLIRLNAHAPMQLLAEQTGGRAILDENDLDAAFAKVGDDLTTYYSLGFRSDGSMKQEGVSVKVRRPGLTVHAAQSVREHNARERIEQAVRSRLYAREEQNPLGIDLRLSRAGKETMGVSVRVPVDALSVIPGREGESAGFDVYVAMMDDNMHQSPMKMVRHVVTPGDSAEVVQWIYLHAKPGKYKVSFAIVDTLSWQTSYFQREMELGGAE